MTRNETVRKLARAVEQIGQVHSQQNQLTDILYALPTESGRAKCQQDLRRLNRKEERLDRRIRQLTEALK